MFHFVMNVLHVHYQLHSLCIIDTYFDSLILVLEERRRIAKQEQLNQLRNNFLRRRTAQTQPDVKVDGKVAKS